MVWWDRRTCLAAALGAALLSGSFGGAAAQGAAGEKVVIRFTWKLKGEYAPLFVALDKGYYKAEGLDVTLSEGSGAQTVLKVVGTGQEHFAYGPAVNALQAVSQELPVKLVALYQTSTPMGVIAFPDVTLKTPKDMEGKSIAISSGETFSDMIRPFAKLNGIDIEQVKRVQLDNSARASQFLARRVDLLSVFLTNDLPKMEHVTGVKFNLLKPADFGLAVPGAALIVNTTWAEQNPELVKKVLRATAKGYADAMADPVAASQAFQKHLTIKEDPGVLERQVKATMASTNAPAGKPIGWQDETTIVKALDLLTETGSLKGRKDPGAYYTNAYLQ
ncbi:ABC transporter substrate-binding protein [Rhodoplanes sp. TEM]|uniref:ABC transporter substrate-binding protein n=1 Tax=Rhodoplanes tepidamans TaxID=200616 RepID=A0ABT5JJ54_RHOTP|nr:MULTISPECIES: ABC transporter substrate-binding protein [Rhodoplanes]MDC7789765.1 ABC transporter substrate-binding protein [Rhodoplanes tepidamans]MDC7985203.1 ABC transporter substrate-binding protein [Rhodoplanes sp. TEM]MDQ0354447.1 NitT/TauT family transport system substrate-binding protein [Rhodoplanes tepidamans]